MHINRIIIVYFINIGGVEGGQGGESVVRGWERKARGESAECGKEEAQAPWVKELKSYNIYSWDRKKMSVCASLQPTIAVLGLPACRNLAAAVLQFLSLEDLEAVAEAATGSNSANYFLQLVSNARFLSQFINRTDKSLYFTFFAEPEYRAIEAAQVGAVTQEGTGVFLRQQAALQEVMQMLREKVPAAEDDLEMLGSLLADPELPLPRLKRETQGMYCTSPFQLFLVDCTFRQDEQEFFCF